MKLSDIGGGGMRGRATAMGQTVKGGEIQSMGIRPPQPAKPRNSPTKQARLDRKLDAKRAALAKTRTERIKRSGVPWETPRNEMKLTQKIQKLRDKGGKSDRNYFG
jgi:hypothetical protein